jgi:hypothetical protein
MTDPDRNLRVVAELGRRFERAERRRRSPLYGSRLAVAFALLGTFAAAAAAGAATGLFSVGDHISPAEPPAPGHPPAGLEETVLATGTAPVSGPWQVSSHGSRRIVDKGEVVQAAGLSCLRILLIERPASPLGGSGYCGTSRPFEIGSLPASDGKDVEVLLWGPAPEAATTVELTARGGVTIRSPTHEGPADFDGDLWVIPAPHTLDGAKVVWLDQEGRPGAPPLEASDELERGDPVASFLGELRARGSRPPE